MADKVLLRRVSSHEVSFGDSLAALRTVGRLAGQLTLVGVYSSGAFGRARPARARENSSGSIAPGAAMAPIQLPEC
jgi:hypothetical protein